MMTTPTTAEPNVSAAPARAAALAPVDRPLLVELPATPSTEWLTRTLNESQIKTLTATVAPGATTDELAVFFWTARRRGLDPFLKQMHFVKRRRRVQRGDAWAWEEYAVHQTGIDGFRVIASRVTGKISGVETALHAGTKRGPIKDKDDNLTGAWAEVYRHDWKEPARVELDFKEYCQYVERNDNGRKFMVPAGLWGTKPQTMIEKCAEAAAQRIAFPEDLGDLYINEEMDSAEHIRRADDKPDPEPRGSATVAREEIVEDAQIVTAPGVAAPSAPPAPVEPEGASAFGEAEPAADPMVEETKTLVEQIMKALESFAPKPTEGHRKKLAAHFFKAEGMDAPTLLTRDTASLNDCLTFLRDLKASKPAAVATMNKLFPSPAKKV